MGGRAKDKLLGAFRSRVSGVIVGSGANVRLLSLAAFSIRPDF